MEGKKSASKNEQKKKIIFRFNMLTLGWILSAMGFVILGMSFLDDSLTKSRPIWIIICSIGIFIYAIRMFFWPEDKKIEKMHKLKKTNISLDKKQRNAIWLAIGIFAFIAISCIIGAILNIKDVVSFCVCILVALSCLFIVIFLYFILIKK